MSTQGEVQAPGPNDQRQQQQGGFQQLFSLVMRLGLMYAFMMYMKSGKKDATPVDTYGKPVVIRPFYTPGQMLDMQVYLSTSPLMPDKLLWAEDKILLCDKDIDLHQTVTLTQEDLAPAIERNQSMYLITRFVVPGTPEQPVRAQGVAFTKSIPLIEFRPPPKEEEGRSLLSGAPEESESASSAAPKPTSTSLDDELDGPLDSQEAGTEEKVPEGPWLPFIKPNMTISMVHMFESQSFHKLPPHIADNLDVSEELQKYYPVIHFNEFWLLKHHLMAVNETVESVEVNLNLNTITNMYWTFMVAFQQSFDMQKGNGLMGEKQIDELKTVFLEGNPYFLALTFIVSMLHSVFDMLAFKNDIGFWRSNKSMEGLSARTILINAGCQVVIFLYLLDNETSTVVLLSAGVGTLIEFWKVTKVMDVTIERTPGGLPKLKFAHRGSYVDTDTKKWDDEATRYMSYALFPCVVGYFIYSLVYEKHKSWYSFILQSLVGCVYTFGFVLMCPQLYLNYKLKSVAHLPWRQMTYKFLNTIIDDLFAFVIKMPLLHRLSVFRDDVVFLIYLYQRWIYRVDRSRVNEFGFSDQDPEEEEQQKAVAGGTAVPAVTEGAAGKSSAVDSSNATKRKGTGGKGSATATATGGSEASKDK